MHSTLVLAITSVALGGLLRAQASVPCYEPNLGALLGSADDAVFPAIPYCIDLLEGPYLTTDESVIVAFRPKKK